MGRRVPEFGTDLESPERRRELLLRGRSWAATKTWRQVARDYERELESASETSCGSSEGQGP